MTTTMLATPEESGEEESAYPFPACYEDPRDYFDYPQDYLEFEETDHGDQLAIQLNEWINRHG